MIKKVSESRHRLVAGMNKSVTKRKSLKESMEEVQFIKFRDRVDEIWQEVFKTEDENLSEIAPELYEWDQIAVAKVNPNYSWEEDEVEDEIYICDTNSGKRLTEEDDTLNYGRILYDTLMESNSEEEFIEKRKQFARKEIAWANRKVITNKLNAMQESKKGMSKKTLMENRKRFAMKCVMEAKKRALLTKKKLNESESETFIDLTDFVEYPRDSMMYVKLPNESKFANKYLMWDISARGSWDCASAILAGNEDAFEFLTPFESDEAFMAEGVEVIKRFPKIYGEYGKIIIVINMGGGEYFIDFYNPNAKGSQPDTISGLYFGDDPDGYIRRNWPEVYDGEED